MRIPFIGTKVCCSAAFSPLITRIEAKQLSNPMRRRGQARVVHEVVAALFLGPLLFRHFIGDASNFRLDGKASAPVNLR